MSKIKIVTLLLGSLVGLVFAAPVYASVLSIQTLPSYINSNNFKLSCTSDGGTYQFEVSKHGGAFATFGPSIDTGSSPCIVQVDSSVVNDQTDYTFRVGDKTTSTIYDISGPSPVSGFYKERPSDGEYKLHWKNPGDSDFDKVVIYRGDAAGFSADASHEIARVSGGPNSDMTYEDHFTPDTGKIYFYVIRALDHAGNSSSLAGDEGTTTVLSTSTATPTAGGGVTVLPKETGGGSILGTEATPSPSPSEITTSGAVNTNPGLAKWILTHKKISLGVVIILAAIGYAIYRFRRKK